MKIKIKYHSFALFNRNHNQNILMKPYTCKSILISRNFLPYKKENVISIMIKNSYFSKYCKNLPFSAGSCIYFLETTC